MAYIFGQIYDGLFASDYDELIALNNAALTDWLEHNLERVEGENFYVYVGDGVDDDQWEMLNVLDENGIDAGLVTTFQYLKSTWKVNGF